MHLSASEVCAAEYAAACRTFSPPVAEEPAPESVTAPGVDVQRGGARNRLAWVAVGAFLADRVVNP